MAVFKNLNLFGGKNSLLIGIVIGVLLGGIVGSFFPEFAVKQGFLGDMFLKALKMIVLPLIIISITLSIMKIGDPKKLGSMGLKTVLYYASTTAIAVFIGIVVVLIISPGEGGQVLTGEIPEKIMDKQDFKISSILDYFIHPNLFQAATEYKILPIIVACILFGVAFATLGKESEIIVKFFEVSEKAVMKIVGWIIFFTPIGVFSLIADRIGEAGGGAEVFTILSQLAKYSLSVVVGLFVHGFIVLPLILMLIARKNPIQYLSHLSNALLTAFSTASSSATLPLTMTSVIENAKVDKKVGRFVLPLGATINMDGTALYEAVAVIFIAQSYGITLGPSELIIVFFTATLAAIGAAGIPEAGLVTMVLVLQAVGLPLEGVGLILSIDWLLDRFRTTINVWGDSVGCAVIDRFENKNSPPV
jgi:Na+/H+-dicarboxylate symporter